MTYRPRYETQTDRDNELAVQKQIEAWASCTLKKTAAQAYVDFEIYRQGVCVALAEFKKRSNPRRQYPTYMVAKKKIERGIALAKKEDVPYIFFVQWTDGLHFLVVNEDTPMTSGTGGRTDRGDAFDIEPMCYFDTSLFRPVTTPAAP
ncbi:hypothetical protein PJKIFABJ_00001 [Pseudomonas phage PE09]|uniref:Uncharacterized protein n=2 Tax=Otagovirus TaxID=2560197 RepID=A0A7S7YBS3_9CAUD|nr:hypothetical protein QGX22_gp001 [Pseudomonas phage PE09]YP_010768309.1 hypothetical protein QGX23_gp001 [Pseudomonas phage PN09]QHZ59956.1 hypothetical protein PJKIFABJ_00001 [Pseudomonas phage PE09]QPB10422.1 hypothetical protein PN09_001 [Pseudomonas phage PN09]